MDVVPESKDGCTPVRRGGRWILWCLGMVVVSLVGVLIWVAYFLDAPPPDDDFMLPRWSDRGGRENPLAVFCRQFRPDREVAFRKSMEEARDLETQDEMREFVERNAGAYAMFETLMATDVRTWQWADAEELGHPDSGILEDSHCETFEGALGVKVRLLSLEGHATEASRTALQIARFGNGLQGAEGGAIEAMISYRIQLSGEGALKLGLTENPVTAETVRACLRELNEIGGPKREDFQFACRTDYLWFKNGLAMIQNGDVESFGGIRAKPTLFKKHYKPNLTLATRVELDGAVIKALDTGWREGLAKVEAAGRVYLGFNERSGTPAFLLEPNYGGKRLLTWQFKLRSFMEEAFICQTVHDQTRIMLALRLFELEHGRLPARLEELVPGYLPAVPEDVFSGLAKMSWDATAKVVYSVGVDGKDSRGVLDSGVTTKRKTKKGALRRHPFRWGPDMGMRYWWGGE